MSKKILFALALIALPFGAAAYSSPESVLFDEVETHMAAPPPIHRETGDRQEEQRKKSQERREREWAENFARQHPKPVATEESKETEESEGTDETEEPTGMTIEPWEDPTRILNDENDDVLHNGAPLAPTGLGTWAAVGAILAATGWTIRRAKPGKL